MSVTDRNSKLDESNLKIPSKEIDIKTTKRCSEGFEWDLHACVF